VLIVATVLQLKPPVTHDATLKVGAVNPLVTMALKATLSTAQPNPPQPVPDGKVFSAVAVIVTVGPAEPLATLRLAVLEVIATNGGLTEFAKSAPDWKVSGTGFVPPFDTVRQTPPATLVPTQPVWTPTLIPAAGVVPTTL